MASERSEWTGPAVYYEAQGGRERAVECTISSAGIALHGLATDFRFAPGMVPASLQGMNDDVRLDLPTPPGGTLIVRGREAAHVLRRTGQLARPTARRRLATPAAWLILLALVVGLVFAFVRGPDVLSGVAVRFVPPDVETALGQQLLQAYLLEHPRVDDPRAQAVLDKCAGALADRDGAEQSRPEIVLVDDPTPNAFALPGGGIVVFTGIIEKMEHESELLGVLAHEMGHVHLRHGLRRVARTAWSGFLVSAVFGDVNGLTAILLDNSTLLVGLSYDRKEERAADAYALRVLHEAGVDASGLAALFERLEAVGGAGSTLPGFLSTHPPTAERLEALRQATTPQHTRGTILSAEEWELLHRRNR